MKEGWEIKKFENCIGKIPKPQQLKTSDYKSKGRYPIVSQEACTISGYTDLQDCVYLVEKPVVIFGDHTRVLKYINFSFVVGADGVKILIPNNEFDSKFFYYYLTWCDIPSLGYSRHYKLLKELNIPVPPLPTQEKIVAELDCINSIIEKKREQLKELDALAQAIFYDMFGDPIRNEKGWETCRVIDVVKMQRGYDLPVQQRNIDGKIPVYGSNGIIAYHNESKMNYGVVTGRSGTIGGVYISHIPFWPLNTTLFSIDTYGNNIVYIKYLLEAFDLKRFKEGAGVPTLNRNNFHNEIIIKVNLELQLQFASKIEAIEKQKELIKRSIAEVETLLASRMQYYFG